MKLNTKLLLSKTLEHPTSLRIFLYTRSKSPECVGIREAQRSLRMVSTHTVRRHFIRLEEAGLVVLLPSNRFVLSPKGSSLQSLQIPVKISSYLFKGTFITSNLFLLSFLVTMFALTLIIVFFKPMLAIVNGLVGLFVSSILTYFQYRDIRKQIRAYLSSEEDM